MAKLNTYVHVHDFDSEEGPAIFGPDDEVPDWAVKKITTPDVWAEEPKPKRGPGRPPKQESE